MPFNPSGAPVAKGRKSQTTRWLDILPTGAPPHTEQGQLSQDSSEAGDKPDDFANQRVALQVSNSRVSGQLQRDIPQPLASQIYTPRPQTPFHRPSNRSQTPIDRSYTPLSRSLVSSDRPRTPSSRPETPQSQRSSGRPPNIVVPSQNRVFGGVIAYNPAEPSQDLDFPSPGPVPRGRRNIPVEASSSHNALPAQLGHSVAPIPSEETTSMSIPRCERGLLIIGSSHQDPTPYTAEFSSLRGVQNDRDRLRSAFQSRQYSVETMVEQEGNKTSILSRVVKFLASAKRGDIRVVVFTGHATRIGTDRQFAIIPWGCSSEDETITSAEWQRIVRENAGAGVVVVSVFATCMSGAAVEQSERLTNFDRIIAKQTSATDSPDGPIQIILSSSGDTQSSFEYHTPSHRSSSTSWHDYFLWALAETTKRTDVDSWESFVKTLQTTFNYVRAAGFRNSSFQYPQDLEWLLRHPQTPHIFASSKMPEFNHFLPPL